MFKFTSDTEGEYINSKGNTVDFVIIERSNGYCYVAFMQNHPRNTIDFYRRIGITDTCLTSPSDDERRIKTIKQKYIELGIPEDQIRDFGIFLEVKGVDNVLKIMGALRGSIININCL